MVKIEGNHDRGDEDNQVEGSQQGYVQGVLQSGQLAKCFFCEKICRKEWAVKIPTQEVYSSNQTSSMPTVW